MVTYFRILSYEYIVIICNNKIVQWERVLKINKTIHNHLTITCNDIICYRLAQVTFELYFIITQKSIFFLIFSRIVIIVSNIKYNKSHKLRHQNYKLILIHKVWKYLEPLYIYYLPIRRQLKLDLFIYDRIRVQRKVIRIKVWSFWLLKTTMRPFFITSHSFIDFAYRWWWTFSLKQIVLYKYTPC